MKKTMFLIILLGGFASVAQAADELPQTCIQIRERIKAVTGLVATPSMDLLQQIGKYKECNFSSAEVYRAAYGDKPLPPQESYDSQYSQERDED
jgi:hypothetical protein